jgi:hypothetical protein
MNYHLVILKKSCLDEKLAGLKTIQFKNINHLKKEPAKVIGSNIDEFFDAS